MPVYAAAPPGYGAPPPAPGNPYGMPMPQGPPPAPGNPYGMPMPQGNPYGAPMPQPYPGMPAAAQFSSPTYSPPGASPFPPGAPGQPMMPMAPGPAMPGPCGYAPQSLPMGAPVMAAPPPAMGPTPAQQFLAATGFGPSVEQGPAPRTRGLAQSPSGYGPQHDDSDDEGDLIAEHSSEGVGGRGFLGIPQAVDVDVSAQDRLGSGDALPNQIDLRQFLRPGDIMNYRGGNRWGHIVLIVSPPDACVARKLLDLPPVPESRGKGGSQTAVRPRLGPQIAQDYPYFLVRVLQSASNMSAIAVTTCTLAIHPRTRQICAVAPAGQKGVMRITEGQTPGVPIDMDCVMSPLSHDTIDYNIFGLCIDEIMRSPIDQEWSFKTAVNSYLRQGKLKSSKYATPQGKKRLAAKMEDRWLKAPICSSVPPRFWQKYLLKDAYKRQVPDPECTWADTVLNFIPVKDDRILPGELVDTLLATRIWDRMDFNRGPPLCRRTDAMPPQALAFASDRRPPARRQVNGQMLNQAGNRVRVGVDAFTIYCGKQVGKAKGVGVRMGRLEARDGEEFVWDGVCGPSNGPQCIDCRRMEDRMLT